MKQKIIIIHIFSLLLFACLTACNKQLSQTPQTQLSDAAFWHTAADLNAACNYLYTFLPGLGTDPTGTPTPYQDAYSNDAACTVAGVASVSDGSRSAPATSAEWSNFYTLIRAANNILQKSIGITGSQASINQFLGEARFFRAWGYFELVKRFGDVPYINRTLSLTDTLLYTGRTNRETVIDSIYSDLDFAAANCPQPDVLQSNSQYGRISATAALAFKSRVALFEGTWDKFHNAGDYSAHLQIAVTAASTVISGGKHSLYTGSGDSSYYYEFQYSGSLAGNPVQLLYGPQINYTYASNKENIIVRLYGQNLVNNIANHSYERTSLEQSALTGSKAMMDAYLFSDGLPEGVSTLDSSNMQTSTLTEFRNRDPRIGMTVWNKTMYFPGLGGINPYLQTVGYRLRKYFVVSDWSGQTSFVNYNVLRYAEVLLNYAEAEYELNGSISDDDLNLTINALRNRATNNNSSRLPLLTNAFVTSNGLNMETEIRRERRVELAYEGLYYWDLLRWKTAENDLPSALLGPKFFPADFPTGTNPNLDTNGFIIIESASKRMFNPARDYLWPLPTKEIALYNGKLVQNPMWQ